jgi:hypothetical protein
MYIKQIKGLKIYHASTIKGSGDNYITFRYNILENTDPLLRTKKDVTCDKGIYNPRKHDNP